MARRRSLLYLPASSERMLAKAAGRGADVLVLDLEDGVHPDHKAEARERLRTAYSTIDWGRSEAFIRVNPADTAWGGDDLLMVRDVAPKAVVLPKAQEPEGVRRTAEAVGVPLYLMVETARGISAADELARVEGVAGLVFGAADYRASVGAGRLAEEMELLYPRSRLVVAARAAGIEVFDTPWFEYKDLDGLEASATRAGLLGFDGKTAIHPGQVEVIHRAFTPSPAEVERARGIVEVMEAALARGDNVATLGGEMVEALHLEEARRVLSRASATG